MSQAPQLVTGAGLLACSAIAFAIARQARKARA
jgi:hypothetical protein